MKIIPFESIFCYKLYSQIKTARELWDSLDKKHKTEDAGTKKLHIFFLNCSLIKIVFEDIQLHSCLVGRPWQEYLD
jgi:hypothetical protein